MVSEDLKLRTFIPEDLERIVEIAKNSFPHPYSRAYFERFYQKEPDSFIVAKSTGQIVGYAIGGSRDGAGQIVSMAVVLDWQGKGIGKALAKFLIEQFQKQGLKKVFLHVRANNQPAVSFYQKLGFGIAKTVENYYPNSDDAYLMEMRFPGG